MNKRIYITDSEVAAILDVSRSTISRSVNGYRKQCKGVEHDINLAKANPVVIGGCRRWKISELVSVLGITVEELEERIK